MPMEGNTLFQHSCQLLENGQASSALSVIDILCEEAPRSTDYLVVRAKALFAMRDFDNVIRVAMNFLEMEELCGSANTSENFFEVLRLGMMAALELSEIKKCVLLCARVMAFDNVLGQCYAGKCAEVEGNKEAAALHYCSALEANPFCGEAMSALIDRHLLDPVRLVYFIDTLAFPSDGEIVRSCYKARVPLYTPLQQSTLFHVPRSLELLLGARRERNENNLHHAYSLTLELLKLQPFNKESVCLFLAILVDMKASQKLFEFAQALSKKKTRPELAVYAIGCFYYTILNFEKAGRYFIRARELDPNFSEAHIAYGHCYARLEEGEEARKVYEKAMYSFPGLHHCAIYLGMQYSRKDQWEKAEKEFRRAWKQVPSDPVVLNELGVVYFSAKNYVVAHKFFVMAYERLPQPHNPSEYQDCVVFNLATSYRKLKMYREAAEYYAQYIKFRPKASCGHFALGLTYHLAGNLSVAVEHYENAQRIKYDSVCAAMLEHAVERQRFN